MSESRIRMVRADDLDAVYDVCVRTSDAGADATALHDDLRLPGHVWAAPYVVHEPEHAFVLVDADDHPIGYVLGALDSPAFEATLERDWWPALRERYPLARERGPADQALVTLIHQPPTADPAVAAEYPSHLHVDLLPVAQGAGAGRLLVEALLDALTRDGSVGVHLGVDARNERALGFYPAIGFEQLRRSDHAVWFARRFA